MHHIFQILSKLKIFVHVLPQVNFALNLDVLLDGMQDLMHDDCRF